MPRRFSLILFLLLTLLGGWVPAARAAFGPVRWVDPAVDLANQACGQAVVAGGKTWLPVVDHVGTVHKLIDADTGAVAAEFFYGPFGETLGEIGDPAALAACPFRFNTKLYDAEIGLYSYGHRYYDPTTAKWISRDPIREAGGINLTGFCGNDPINRVDPLGLSPITDLDTLTAGAPRTGAVAFAGPVAPIGSFNRLSDMDQGILDASTVYSGLSPYLDLASNFTETAPLPRGVSIWQPTGERYYRDPRHGHFVPIPTDGTPLHFTLSTVALEAMLRRDYHIVEMYRDQYGQRRLNAPFQITAPSTLQQMVEGASLLPAAWVVRWSAATRGVSANSGIMRGTKTWDGSLPAGKGKTDKFGNVTLSSQGTALDRLQVELHEGVHSMLSPSQGGAIATFRANARMWGYHNSTLLRYTEEVWAETVAQLGSRHMSGLSVGQALREGLWFPFGSAHYRMNGTRLGLEAAGAGGAIGSAAYLGYELGQ